MSIQSMVINRVSCAIPGHHLHGSSSSLNHWATSSTSSPATHRHCICLQHDLLTALKTRTGACKCNQSNCCSSATRAYWINHYSHGHMQNKSDFFFFLPKTEPERLFIAAAVRKARTGRLGLADATSFVTPVNL